jgi:hypothetical protein
MPMNPIGLIRLENSAAAIENDKMGGMRPLRSLLPGAFPVSATVSAPPTGRVVRATATSVRAVAPGAP